MDKYFNSHVLEARYVKQRIPRYQGNPLIEALPLPPDEEQLFNWLQARPDFHPDQRQWATHDRIQMLMGLSNFMVPLARHFELAHSIDSLIREGYMGRAPRTPEHTQIFQRIYDNTQNGKVFDQDKTLSSAPHTRALIGLSGLGKTTTFNRIAGRYPEVIFHPGLHLWQVPFLHIEAPYDGASVKGLAHSILRKMDELIPDSNYYELYALKGKPGAETLINHAARVLHAHCVGMVVVDEIQNLSNASSNEQKLMTLLVSHSNVMKIPMLFIGTNKAKRLLGLDFRQARRASGLAPWDRLQRQSLEQPQEWEDFLSVLWQFQWVKQPVQLNESFSQAMYFYTQGIIDLAIQLFMACQARAMHDGSETLSANLIDVVWKANFGLLEPMVSALRRNDIKALAQFEDIAPMDIDSIIRDINLTGYGQRIRSASVGPDNELFVPLVSNALNAMGVDEDTSRQLAEMASGEAGVGDVLDGTKSAIAKLKPPRRVSTKATPVGNGDFVYSLDDYRRAVQAAKLAGTSVLQQLTKFGMAPNLEDIIPIE